MAEEWVMIRTETDNFKSEIIRTLLEEHGISCVLMNKKDSAYSHLGEIEIFVSRNAVVFATHLLSKSEI